MLKKKHLYKYHIIIDITGQFLTALFCFNPFRQKKQYIFGFFNGEIGRFMYNKFINNNMLNYVHEIENFKIVLQHFGISCSSWNPKVYYPSEYKVKKIPDKDFIICHIGSGFEYKLWPLEKWSSLLNKILKSSKVFDIIIIGDESEKNICSSIIKDISTIYKMRIKNMVGKTNFLESYSLVNSAYLFIGNDSVFSHVAASKNIPSIQIMNGANSKDRWGIEYFGSHAKVVVGLDKNHNCQLKNCKYPCLHMKEIGVENIFKLYNELIK